MPRKKTKISDEQLKFIESMSAYRIPMENIASAIGMSKDTLERRAKDDSRVSAAILKGRSSAAAKIHKIAYEMASSGKNTAMTIFYLKTQYHWKETSKHEVTGQDGERLVPEEKPMHERLEELAKLVAILKLDEPK